MVSELPQELISHLRVRAPAAEEAAADPDVIGFGDALEMAEAARAAGEVWTSPFDRSMSWDFSRAAVAEPDED